MPIITIENKGFEIFSLADFFFTDKALRIEVINENIVLAIGALK